MADTAAYEGRPKGVMSEGELKAILMAKITNSLGYYGGKLSQARVTALQYYMGEPFGNEIDGRSQVVSRDVAEAIDAMMPSLMKIFASGTETVRFDAQKPTDEEKADQATDYINWIWQTQNNGFEIFYNWFKDALLNRIGAVKIWWDEQEEIAKERYRALTDAEYEILMQDAEEDGLDILEHDEYPDPLAAVAAAIPSPAPPGAANGAAPPQPALPAPMPAAASSLGAPTGDNSPETPPQAAMLHDVVLQRTNKNGRIRILPIPGEEFLMDRRAISLEETPFSAHRVRKTVSDLVEMGYDYDLVKTLGEGDSSDFNLERLERFRQEDELPYRTGNNYDPAMREIWITECYAKIDYDGDGIAELRKVTIAGESGNFAPGAMVVLDNEEVDDHPFAALCPIPMPHKFYGNSIADQTMDLQLIKSTLWRSSLDHTYNAIMPQIGAVEGQVNLDDLLNRRPGGVVRVKNPEALIDIPNGQLGIDPFQMISYIDQVREQRTGVQRFTAGPGADALNNAYTDTATGANLVENASQERLELVARCFAEIGVKPAFRKILKLVCENQKIPRMVRLRGTWVAMDPREWDTEFDVTVSVGLGTGNRQQQLQMMSTLLNVDKEVVQLQGGAQGPLVTYQDIYHKLDKLCQFGGLKGAEGYYSDPATQPAPSQQQHADPTVQAAQIKAQSTQQTTQMQLQADQQKFQAQGQLDQQKAQQDAQFEALKLKLQMAADAQKAAMQLQSSERIALAKIAAEREVEYARIAAEREEFNAQSQLEVMRHSTETALRSREIESTAEARDKDRESSERVAVTAAKAKAKAKPAAK